MDHLLLQLQLLHSKVFLSQSKANPKPIQSPELIQGLSKSNQSQTRANPKPTQSHPESQSKLNPELIQSLPELIKSFPKFSSKATASCCSLHPPPPPPLPHQMKCLTGKQEQLGNLGLPLQQQDLDNLSLSILWFMFWWWWWWWSSSSSSS